MRGLVGALRQKLPQDASDLARAEALLAAAEATLARRAGAGLTEAIFAELPRPRPLAGLPGLEAWHSPGAPLPWRVLLLAEPGLGGSAHPGAPGWWLRWLVAETVLSEALDVAEAEAVLGPEPGLILTLATAQAAGADASGALAATTGGA
jgi:hypothetical protein